MTLVEITGLLGRDSELKQLNNALANGANILLIAPNGFGKTALWEHTRELANDYGYFSLEMPDTTFAKAVKSAIQEYHEKCPDKFFLPQSVVESDLSHLAQKTLRETGQLPWNRLAHFFGRINVEKAIHLLLYSLHYMKESALHLTADVKTVRKPIIFVRNLRRVTDANTPAFLNLFHYCQIIAVLDSQYQGHKHLKSLRQNFQSILELRPLPTDVCRRMAETWLEKNYEVAFENEKARRLFVEHIARDSGGGVPGAVEQLLNKALTEPEITRDKIREFEWDGIEYMSMYPLWMIGLAMLTIFRTLGHSMGDMTWLVVGAVSAALLIISFFLRPVLDKE